MFFSFSELLCGSVNVLYKFSALIKMYCSYRSIDITNQIIISSSRKYIFSNDIPIPDVSYTVVWRLSQ